MLDHIGVPVSDFERSRNFYQAILEPLGYRVMMEAGPDVTGSESFAGFGLDHPAFWISSGGPVKGRLHVAFAATTRKAVDRFHDAALAAGATDNGGPGLRTEYHEHYYGAFVLDPDGHNIEAVYHRAK